MSDQEESAPPVPPSRTAAKGGGSKGGAPPPPKRGGGAEAKSSASGKGKEKEKEKRSKKKEEEEAEEEGVGDEDEGHMSEVEDDDEDDGSEDGEEGGGDDDSASVSSASIAAGDGRRRLSLSESLEAYRSILKNDDPQQGAKKRRMKTLRSLVSKKKKRYKDRQFDLDLAYITERIIAMGFPAEKKEALYRNPMKTVQKFLNMRHGGHYKVYNLCSERSYDAERFEKFAAYPFDDHHCPTLEVMDACVRDVDVYLSEDPDNVAVIHCKAGKGRTGVMICALLYYRYRSKGMTVQDALGFYGDRRTFDKKGVTINSQRRFILYYADWLANPEMPLDVPVRLTRLTILHPPKLDSSFFIIYNEAGCKRYSSLVDSSRAAGPGGAVVFEVPAVELRREVRVDFHLSEEKKLFYVWFHTAWAAKEGTLSFGVEELDGKVGKKKNAKKYSRSFTAKFDFAGAAPAAAPKGKKGGAGKKKKV